MTERELETLLALTDGMDNNTAVLVKRLCQSYAMAAAERDMVTKRMVSLERQVSALIRAVSTCSRRCEFCSHTPDTTNCEHAEFDCKNCDKPCRCATCANGSNWIREGEEYA